jgi:hypothetical protein
MDVGMPLYGAFACCMLNKELIVCLITASVAFPTHPARKAVLTRGIRLRYDGSSFRTDLAGKLSRVSVCLVLGI